MIRENEVKKSFRIAFDALGKCPEPVNTKEYYSERLEEFMKLNRENPDLTLLPHLLIAVVDWLAKVAADKEAS